MVTSASPFEKLAFTVHDISGDFDEAQSENDGIFYTLTANKSGVLLTVKQGDFEKVGTKGKEFCDATTRSWQNTLPVIKKLAEQ